jgi:DNA-binding MarR family transcriptional regulator
MSTNKVQNAHIIASLPELHRALIDMVGEMNRPERDAAMLDMAGLTLERALFPLLVLVERLGPIGVVELAGRVGRDYTTVSRQVARLEELGLVSVRRRGRSTNGCARRSSPAGQDRDRRGRCGARARQPGAVRRLGAKDFDELVRLMRKLGRRIGRVGGRGAAIGFGRRLAFGIPVPRTGRPGAGVPKKMARRPGEADAPRERPPCPRRERRGR